MKRPVQAQIDEIISDLETEVLNGEPFGKKEEAILRKLSLAELKTMANLLTSLAHSEREFDGS